MTYEDSGYNKFLERLITTPSTGKLSSLNFGSLIEDGSIDPSKISGEGVANENLTTPARSATAVVALDNTGTFKDIQAGIDYANEQGGGEVKIRNGTYTVTSNIVIPSKITLTGESLGGVTLVLAGACSIKSTGSGYYATGTISITKGGVLVTGSGTTWLTNLTTSHTIVINDFPYTISAVSSNGLLVLSSPYHGPTLTNATYYAAVFNSGIEVSKLTITGSTTHGIDFQYVDNFSLDNVVVAQCGGMGINIDHCLRLLSDYAVCNGNTLSGMHLNSTYLVGLRGVQLYNNSSHGLLCDDVSQTLFQLCPCKNNTTDGMQINNSEQISLVACEGSQNGRNGIYLTTVNKSNFVAGGSDNNVVDGIKIDTDSNKNKVIGWESTGNSGYGVNVVVSSCDKNRIIGCDLDGNDLGTINDSGTGTIDLGN